MKIGMLWYDNSNEALSIKLGRAIGYYQGKYGQMPTLAVVHTSTIVDERCKIMIEKSKQILPNHIWLGIGENDD